MSIAVFVPVNIAANNPITETIVIGDAYLYN